jgi:hypothetical protein
VWDQLKLLYLQRILNLRMNPKDLWDLVDLVDPSDPSDPKNP